MIAPKFLAAGQSLVTTSYNWPVGQAESIFINPPIWTLLCFWVLVSLLLKGDLNCVASLFPVYFPRNTSPSFPCRSSKTVLNPKTLGNFFLPRERILHWVPLTNPTRWNTGKEINLQEGWRGWISYPKPWQKKHVIYKSFKSCFEMFWDTSGDFFQASWTSLFMNPSILEAFRKCGQHFRVRLSTYSLHVYLRHRKRNWTPPPTLAKPLSLSVVWALGVHWFWSTVAVPFIDVAWLSA